MTELPLSANYDDNHQVGSVKLTDYALDIFNDGGKRGVLYAIAPVFNIIRQDKDGTIQEAELIGLSMVRADHIVRTCRVCKCTEDNCQQCVEKTGELCYWVELDLCSACKGAA